MPAKPKPHYVAGFGAHQWTGQPGKGAGPLFIGAGFMNLNRCVLTIEIVSHSAQETATVIRGAAKEGLIKQHTAEKAVARVIEAIKTEGSPSKAMSTSSSMRTPTAIRMGLMENRLGRSPASKGPIARNGRAKNEIAHLANKSIHRRSSVETNP